MGTGRDRELRVGDVVTAHERSLSGFHRGAGSELKLPHSELKGTSQTLVLLSGDSQMAILSVLTNG